MESLGDRIDTTTASRVKFAPAAVTLRDAGHWPGLRIERWEGASEPLPESVLPYHALAVSIDTFTASEVVWSGHRPQASKLVPGSVTILPAGIPYRAASSGYWRGHMVAISRDYLRGLSRPASHGAGDLIPRLGQQDAFVREAVKALVAEVEADYPMGVMYGEAIGAALVAHLVRMHAVDPRLAAVDGCAGDPRREWVRAYILDQLDRQITLADLAQLLHMDVFAVTRWFKSEFGVPPHQFVMRARVERARGLLERSDAPLVDIALACGFSSQSHLTTVFRRFVGVPPGIYRSSFLPTGRHSQP